MNLNNIGKGIGRGIVDELAKRGAKARLSPFVPFEPII